MRHSKEDIWIIVVSVVIAVVSASCFVAFMKREKQTETEDIYKFLADKPQALLAINNLSAFNHLLLEKDTGYRMLQHWIPDVFLHILQQNKDLPFMLLSFHPEGVVCYAKANNKQKSELEGHILKNYFPAYAPQEKTEHGIHFRYYADAGSRFLGCYRHEGIWVASYSKHLLENIVRKQLLLEKHTGEHDLSTYYSRFDKKATANILIPSEDWQVQIARNDTVLWKYSLPWINADLFPGEGDVCTFCSFPCTVPADSLLNALGDSIASRIGKFLPSLKKITPQTSKDSSEVYFTFCSPL